jgi:hypothetical protein
MRLFVSSIVALLILVSVFVLPIEVADTYAVPGKLLPARAWTVARTNGGTVETTLRDHARGTVESYLLNRFERGDAVRFFLRPGLQPSMAVSVGDTMASIFSSEAERELARLSGDLEATVAALNLYTSGEKAAIVREAQMQLTRAEEQATQHLRELERLRTLRTNDLISAQELEVAESRQRVYDAELAARRARLDAALTGAKPEQVDLTRTEIAALNSEIEKLNTRLGLYTLTSPLSGVITRSTGPDTLLAVIDTTSFVVVMPVPVEQHGRLRLNQEVDVRIRGTRSPALARVMQLGDTVQRLQGHDVLLVTAVISTSPEPPKPLYPGARAVCTFDFGKLRLWEYVKRRVQQGR